MTHPPPGRLILVMALVSAVLLSCAAAAPALPEVGATVAAGGEAVPIAVLPLGLRPQVRELYPQLAQRSVGLGVHNMLLDHLFETDRFRFVEDSPEVLEDLIERQWLSTTGAVTAETAVRTGRLLGARYVVYGEVSQFTSQKIKKKLYETRIRIQVRLVDVETGELVPASGIGAVTRKGKIYSKSDPVEFARSTVGEATDAALAEAVAGLIKRVPWNGE